MTAQVKWTPYLIGLAMAALYRGESDLLIWNGSEWVKAPIPKRKVN
jgi:hypothetical protein